MKPSPCARVFEVEAARDGRLVGAELASFERHMTTCTACSREARALDALADAIGAIPTGKGDLHARRERTRLLAAFDHGLVMPRRRWVARSLLWAASIAALVVGPFVFWRARLGQPERPSNVVVHAESATVWSERTEGDLERVRLERGSLLIHVEHSAERGRRVVVVLPDGELEDTGTTFTVSVEDERTTRVAVQDGSVVLRVRGQWAVAIGAGETWTPDLRPAASACPSSAPPPPEPTPIREAAPSARPAPPASSHAPLTPAPVPPLPDPSIEFRAAMAALDAGDNAAAAAAFASFLVKHPHDPRAEDAAYLRVIALQRDGDDGSMKRAAEAYLRRYPAGFRGAEIENSLGDAGK